MKKIAIAARFPLLREGLIASLKKEENFSVDGFIGTAPQLEKELLENPPDLLILDFQFDPCEKEPLYLQIHAHFPHIFILMLSIEANAKQIKKAISAGVSGVLLITVEKEQLFEAIHKISAGGRYIHEPIQNLLLGLLFPSESRKKYNFKLTKREKEILQLIIEEYTSKEIAEKLFISHCTVETHRLNLIQKLGVKNTAGLVREALQLHIFNS